MVTGSFTPIASADTVIRSETVDLLPAGRFDDSAAWITEAEQGYQGEPADSTTVIISEGKLRVDHDRAETTTTDILWSTSSPTGSTLSINAPDGNHNWSRGPVIEVTGFDMSSVSMHQFRNLSLVVAYRIPDALQDDSVRFILEWPGRTELVREISHTWQAVDHSASNPMVIPLDDDENWSWSLIGQISVTIDYVSVGGNDDSEVQVDAVGLSAKHLTPDFGLEVAKAAHTTPALSTPVLDFDGADGVLDGLAIAQCGIELAIGAATGTWEILGIQRPHDQSWGRIHVSVIGNASLETRGSGQSSWTTVGDGSLLTTASQNIDVKVRLLDGCIEGLRIDVNDPTIHLEGTVSGSTAGIIENLSGISLAIEGELVIDRLPLQDGQFSASAPIGHLLPSQGDAMEIGVAARFQWSSDGDDSSLEVVFDSITITGGYLIEWDRNPACSPVDDQIMVEDGGGRLIWFQDGCSDDITAVEDLVVNVTSSDTSIVQADMLGDSIRLQPQAEQFGDVVVSVSVSDQRDNVWTDSFVVSVTSVDDPPIISGLPMTEYIEIGIAATIALDISDPDTTGSELSIMTDRSWATVDAFHRLTLAPVQPGQHTVTISVSDSSSTTTMELEVIATARSDLEVEAIEIRRGGEVVTVATEEDILAIDVYVRNSGSTMATAVTVRCELDGTIIDSVVIDSLAPGALTTIRCDWQALAGAANITASVDPTDQIEEVDEHDNLRTIAFPVSEREDETTAGGFASGDSAPLLEAAMYIAAAAIILAAIIFLQIGPGKVKRPYQRPPNRR